MVKSLCYSHPRWIRQIILIAIAWTSLLVMMPEIQAETHDAETESIPTGTTQVIHQYFNQIEDGQVVFMTYHNGIQRFELEQVSASADGSVIYQIQALDVYNRFLQEFPETTVWWPTELPLATVTYLGPQGEEAPEALEVQQIEDGEIYFNITKTGWYECQPVGQTSLSEESAQRVGRNNQYVASLVHSPQVKLLAICGGLVAIFLLWRYFPKLSWSEEFDI